MGSETQDFVARQKIWVPQQEIWVAKQNIVLLGHRRLTMAVLSRHAGLTIQGAVSLFAARHPQNMSWQEALGGIVYTCQN